MKRAHVAAWLILCLVFSLLLASCAGMARDDLASTRAVMRVLYKDNLEDGRVPPPPPGWQAGMQMPVELMYPYERKDAIACPSPLDSWGQHAHRWNTEKRAVMYVTRVGWLTPEDVFAGQFQGEYDRKHFEPVAGSQQFGEDVRGGRRFVTEAWRFRALEREWDGGLYLLPSSDGTGTFVFGFCAGRPTADNTARAAFLEFVDAFEETPRGNLDAIVGRAVELQSAIHEWARRLPPAEVPARLRSSRERAIADISAAPGADNSVRAFNVMAILEAFNDRGVEFGPGYIARNVARNLEKANSLAPEFTRDDLLGRAYLDLGEYDKAIASLERHVQSKRLGPFSQSWFHLGEAWRAKGEPERAAAAYGKAREMIRKERPLVSPQIPAGQATLRRLEDLEKRIEERLSETTR